jgi:RNA polymerase sigma factor (sigma-70 family)
VAVTLSHADREAGDGVEYDVLALHQALEKLSEHDERAARGVEMAYFGGMEREEIACVLGVSVPTVERDLRFARAWLNRQLA